jgi:hypothetical protein
MLFIKRRVAKEEEMFELLPPLKTGNPFLITFNKRTLAITAARKIKRYNALLDESLCTHMSCKDTCSGKRIKEFK